MEEEEVDQHPEFSRHPPDHASRITNQSKIKNIFRLTLVLAASLVTLLLVELWLRAGGYTVGGRLLKEGKNLKVRGDTKIALRFHEDTFPLTLKAPKGVKRVFFFGGSSTKGFPYQQYSWPSFFEAALESESGPARIQAVNFGVLQAAMRDVRIIFEELLKRGIRPDAVVIHSGNNELYYNRVRILDEAHRPLPRLLSALSESRLAELIESRLPGSKVPEAPFPLHRLYPLNETNLRHVADAYEKDLLRIVRRCRSEQIPIVLTTVPINRDYWSPSFLAQPGFTSERAAPLQALAAEGGQFFHAGKLDESEKKFRQVLSKMPNEPKSNFYLGRILLKKNKGTRGQGDKPALSIEHPVSDPPIANPLLHLETALRHDVVVALRPAPEFLERVRKIAKQFAGQSVYLIDFDRIFLKRYGIDGRRLFIDNCHGKPETYLEMGVETARFFALQRILVGPPAVPDEAVADRLRKTIRLTEEELNRAREFVETWLGKNDFSKTKSKMFVNEYLRDFEAYKKELRKRGMLK